MKRLEPDEGKLSSPVLRGGGGGNVVSLPDYVGVEVKSSRAGVTLGDGCLYGIEYDGGSDREYLTQTAFDLASQAISEANDTLRTLCGCH